ncbi:MAG: hypothetical protein GY810_27060 [Aureispira sp.]|nr:hypothetical protein [Aureispira sp.]
MKTKTKVKIKKLKKETNTLRFIEAIPYVSTSLLIAVVCLTGLFIWGLFAVENTIYNILIKLMFVLLMGMFWIDIYWQWSQSGKKMGVWIDDEKLRYNTQWGNVEITWDQIQKASISSSTLGEKVVILDVKDKKKIFKQVSFVTKLAFYVSMWYNSSFFALGMKHLNIEESEFLALLNKKLEHKKDEYTK